MATGTPSPWDETSPTFPLSLFPFDGLRPGGVRHGGWGPVCWGHTVVPRSQKTRPRPSGPQEGGVTSGGGDRLVGPPEVRTLGGLVTTYLSVGVRVC